MKLKPILLNSFLWTIGIACIIHGYTSYSARKAEEDRPPIEPQRTIIEETVSVSTYPESSSEAAFRAGVQETTAAYVLNKNTKVFHNPECSSVKQMSPKNRLESSESRETIINLGYKPCSRCSP